MSAGHTCCPVQRAASESEKPHTHQGRTLKREWTYSCLSFSSFSAFLRCSCSCLCSCILRNLFCSISRRMFWALFLAYSTDATKKGTMSSFFAGFSGSHPHQTFQCMYDIYQMTHRVGGTCWLSLTLVATWSMRKRLISSSLVSSAICSLGGRLKRNRATTLGVPSLPLLK